MFIGREEKEKRRRKAKKEKLTIKKEPEKGWVDCNAPDRKGGYKSCGRSDGEKRKKCAKGACKKMKGSKEWGKKEKKRRMKLTKEALKRIIKED